MIDFNNKQKFDTVGTYDAFPDKFFTYFVNKITGKITCVRFSYDFGPIDEYGAWENFDLNCWWENYMGKQTFIPTKKYEYLREKIL